MLLFPLGAMAANGISADASKDNNIKGDSIEMSLLTCSPRQEVYSLYGHTAIRYRNITTGEDWAFNYGVFNFNKPFFVLRFTFGLTDYELGVIPFRRFVSGYKRAGCRVTEQELNLTIEEKYRLLHALNENYAPQNRTYRYNYLYDNCTTRARDIIERSITGTVEYRINDSLKLSYRDMLHEKTEHYPWATTGNDLCLGVKADMNTDWRERQFLPEVLMKDFETATIADSEGIRPLVKQQRALFDTTKPIAESSFPLTPVECATILLVLIIAVSIVEWRRGRTFVIVDAMLMTLVGVAGTLILALFFSQHPTTSTNLQILLLNPLPLFFIHKVIKRRKSAYWKLSLILISTYYMGGLVQHYADGMDIIAFCLLCRVWMNIGAVTKISQTEANRK